MELKELHWNLAVFQRALSTCGSQLSPPQSRAPLAASITLLCPKYISWTIIKSLSQTEELWGPGNGNWFRTALSRQFHIKSNMASKTRREREGEVKRNYRSSHNTLQETSISQLRTFYVAPHGHVHPKTFMFSAKEEVDSEMGKGRDDIGTKWYLWWSVHPSSHIY